MITPPDVSVAIPTYGRGDLLVATLGQLRTLEHQPGEILVIDQTPSHPSAAETELAMLAARRQIKWLRLKTPGIPGAMNAALRSATRPVVLFLDDDVTVSPGLVASHAAGYQTDDVWAVAGQVLQAGQAPVVGPPRCTVTGFRRFLDFPFNATQRAWVEAGVACNLSVRRDKAVLAGGFDSNFLGVSYRFETEFCRRLCRVGGRILFEPSASVVNHHAPAGGIRRFGRHVASARPEHGVGDYYFALKEGLTGETVGYILKRPVREVCTRFHLRHPWWIPPKLLGEVRALLWALRLVRNGPRHLDSPDAARP